MIRTLPNLRTSHNNILTAAAAVHWLACLSSHNHHGSASQSMVDMKSGGSRQRECTSGSSSSRHRPRDYILLLVGLVAGWGIGVSLAPHAIPPETLLWWEHKAATRNSANSVWVGGTTPEETENDGWKLVHVFQGQDDKHLEILTPFSQAKQDELVASLLNKKKQGYFVDLAAHDATYLSNTYRLEQEHDWTGVCIEANPAYWSRLAHRRCHVVAAAVGKDTNEEIDFRIGADGALGGIEHHDFDNKPQLGGGNKLSAKKMYTVTLRQVLERVGAPSVMDYMSLDVEGAEFFIMENFPFHEFRFNLMTVERPNRNLQDLFAKHGYEKLCNISEFGETLWVHQDAKNFFDLSILDQPGICFGRRQGVQRAPS